MHVQSSNIAWPLPLRITHVNKILNSMWLATLFSQNFTPKQVQLTILESKSRLLSLS